MKKVLFVATVVKTHIMQFHIPYLKMLKEMGFETAVAARNDYENPSDCIIPYCDNYYDIPFERNPFKSSNIRAYRQLKKLIDEGDYSIIHCHTPVGGATARLAAIDARKKGTKVFYTAHGFHFYSGAPILNWLLFYPAERLLAHYTDVLITINKEDYARARRFKAKRTEYLPGVGIDNGKFSGYSDKGCIRDELGIGNNDFVILSVGELIPRKNHIAVINALHELKIRNGIEGIHYLICGQGKLRKELQRQVSELGLDPFVHFLGYRKDISHICHDSDIFIFMSLQEGLPVALMEAMASGLPVICSPIRGNTDLVQDNVNGLIVKNAKRDIADAITVLRDNPELRYKLSENALESIKKYEISNVTSLMEQLYKEEMG